MCVVTPKFCFKGCFMVVPKNATTAGAMEYRYSDNYDDFDSA